MDSNPYEHEIDYGESNGVKFVWHHFIVDASFSKKAKNTLASLLFFETRSFANNDLFTINTL
jgi:hypothetical protein